MSKIWRLICLTVVLVLVLSLGTMVPVYAEVATWTQTISDAEGMDEYRWYNEDFGWTHTGFDSTGIKIISARLAIRAEDVDWGEDPYYEHDVIYVDGNKIGELRGSNEEPDVTTFNIDPELAAEIFKDGKADVFVDIDSTHNTRYWAVTIDWSRFTIERQPLVPVKANFSAAPTAGEAPLTVQFRDMSTGNVTSWHWNFGDGTTSSERFPAHIYTIEGIFGVSLTVKGPGGQDTISKPSLVIVEDQAIPARLSVRNLNINPAYPQSRQQIQITAEVANTGGGWGSQTVSLKINGQVEQSLPVGVAAGTSQPVSFTVYKVDPGKYSVDIEGVTGSFTVLEPVKTATGLGPGGVLDTTGIIAIVVIGVVVVGGAVTAFLMRRP